MSFFFGGGGCGATYPHSPTYYTAPTLLIKEVCKNYKNTTVSNDTLLNAYRVMQLLGILSALDSNAQIYCSPLI